MVKISLNLSGCSFNPRASTTHSDLEAGILALDKK